MVVVCVGCVWQYFVFGGQLVLFVFVQEFGYVFGDVCGVEYFGVVEFDQYGVFGVFCVVVCEGDFVQFVGVVVVWVGNGRCYGEIVEEEEILILVLNGGCVWWDGL